MTLDKDKRFESKKYLSFVRSLPCASCGTEADLTAHHLRHDIAPYAGGMSYKAHDFLTMPLCGKCHSEMHTDTTLWWDQPRMIFKTWTDAIGEGVIKIT